ACSGKEIIGYAFVSFNSDKKPEINSFEKQGIMKTLGAQLVEVEKGQVTITCEFSEALTQQFVQFVAKKSFHNNIKKGPLI
ncbi:MAG: hypothetical protein LBS55_09770, partial [Prevotellaceae bacterium]|nr:hypothetical protein [Prevotellaceae bacterium]